MHLLYEHLLIFSIKLRGRLNRVKLLTSEQINHQNYAYYIKEFRRSSSSVNKTRIEMSKNSIRSTTF